MCFLLPLSHMHILSHNFFSILKDFRIINLLASYGNRLIHTASVSVFSQVQNLQKVVC